MKNQKYSSKDTSINKTKLPAIYGILKRWKIFSDKPTVLDYGCGKYFDGYNLGNNFKGYDPFNYDRAENLNNHYDMAILSNVLNVIYEDDIRHDILETLKTLADTVYITVYEGKKDGVGTVTKKDCYQLNRKVREYLPEVREVFFDVTLKNGVIICK